MFGIIDALAFRMAEQRMLRSSGQSGLVHDS